MSRYSVLMSVYYKEKAEYLSLAVESMLNQTEPPDDFVLVCDGPLTEELDRVIGCFENENPELFQIVRLEKNVGLGKALNVGLEYCRNELVARMDSDDITHPQRMEWQLEYLKNNPDVTAVGGQISEFENNPEEIKAYRNVPCFNEDIEKRVKSRNPMNHMTVTFKASVVKKAGGYPDILYFEDYGLWVIMIANGEKFANVPHVCCNMRTGEGMYKRRGGKVYFASIRKMEKLLLDKGLISYPQYIKNIAVRCFGAVMLSPTTRKFTYKIFLRKTKYNDLDES